MRNINWRRYTFIRPNIPKKRSERACIGTSEPIQRFLAANIARHVIRPNIDDRTSVWWDTNESTVALVDPVDVKISDHLMCIAEAEGSKQDGENSIRKHFD